MTVEELLHGMIIQSGNDACVALAEVIAGTEESFAQMMNREAQRLGLKNTHFTNSTGLPDPQHYSTARDLAQLAAALIRDFPEYYPIYSQEGIHATTTSPSPTATACCGSTRPSTASRPATPKRPATA